VSRLARRPDQPARDPGEHRPRSPRGPLGSAGAPGALAGFLARPVAAPWCVLWWVLASGLFVFNCQLAGGPATGDDVQSVYAAWAIAHGHVACAYPPAGIAGYTPTSPLYVLVSAALVALFAVGHAVAFPTAAQLGAHCAGAASSITQWSAAAHALAPTLRFGFVSWLALAAGTVSLLRASGRGRCRWEPATLLVMACLPPVIMCVCEYFHPQDLLAMGLALAGVAEARRGRWGLVGALMSLAYLAQPFALLVAVALLVLCPARRRARFVQGALAAAVVVAVPLVVLTSGRALATVLLGTGTTTASASLLSITGAHGALLFSVSRILPIAAAALLAGWASERMGAAVLEPAPLVALTATCLTMRLIFEVNTFGYYVMAAAVSLVLLDVVRARPRLTLLAWLVVATLASFGDGAFVGGTTTLSLPVWLWQLVVDSWAIALGAVPLVTLVRASPSRADRALAAHGAGAGASRGDPR